MTVGRRTVCGAAIAGAVLALPLVVAAEEMTMPAKTLVLTITGAVDARVRGRCVVERAGGEEEVIELDQVVPFERRFEALGLRCALDADGRVDVAVDKDGSHTLSRTNCGRVNINVR